VIANITRKPLWGFRAMVGAALFMGTMSFLVWAHHMFLTGMGPTLSGFFQVTTMIISIPSVIIVSALLLSLSGGSIRFTVPGLFALGFLPMFGIGGLTGLPLGLAATDIPLHDTYYVIGHFHYIVAPGTMFALFAGIYYWYPKVTGRRMNDMLGKLHFWGTLIGMNGIFLPMFLQGLAGMNRRLYDGGRTYEAFRGFDGSFAGPSLVGGISRAPCRSCSSSISSGAFGRARGSVTIRGTRRRSSGRPRRPAGTQLRARRPSSIAMRTATACQARPETFRRKVSREHSVHDRTAC
jgi:heme/copper-type cytochrome/quinol oxidase subunit 1